MQIKHFLLILILGGLPTNLKINGNEGLTKTKERVSFLSGSNSITATKQDIIQAAQGESISDYGNVVYIEFTSDFGSKLFSFTSKNIGKQLIIKTTGIQIGKKIIINHSYTDRIRVTGLNKKETELLLNNLKKYK